MIGALMMLFPKIFGLRSDSTSLLDSNEETSTTKYTEPTSYERAYTAPPSQTYSTLHKLGIKR